MKLARIAAAFLMLPLAASGAEKRVMESGLVISQNIGSNAAGTYAAPIGNATVAVPIYRSYNRVSIETTEYIFDWSEEGSSFIVLAVNGTVQFYRDKDKFVVLDSKNKKHKFSLVGMRKK